MKQNADWQREADLISRKPIRLLTEHGGELQAPLKPNVERLTRRRLYLSMMKHHRQTTPRAQ